MYLGVFPFFVNFTCYGFACEFFSLINLLPLFFEDEKCKKERW